MEGTSLLSLPEGMLIEQIQLTENGLMIEVVATTPTACCPLCSEPSSSIHCHYRRTLRDAPCAGRRVRLSLTVRKFSCRNPSCERKVFAERLPDFVEPWARMTIRYCQQITSIGLATCGKGGTRLAARLGIQTTRQTILRRIMDLPEVSTGSVLFLGIDDFSFRRGYRFGTILVNLESRRVVDLLPDRQAETAAAWMYHHPDLFVVSRDRGSAYASAASQAAPQATQCADRFHVVKNLTEATQLLLARCQAEILAAKDQEESNRQEPNKPLISIEQWRPPEPRSVEKARLARRASRYARYQQVLEFGQQGMTPKEIAGRLGLSSRTVQKWLAAATFPEARKRRKNRVPLMPLPLLCSNAGKRENTRELCSIERSKRKATPARSGAFIATLLRSSRQRFKPRSTSNGSRNIRRTRLSGCLCAIPRRSMRSSKRIWLQSGSPVLRSKKPTTSFKASWQWSTSEKESG